MRRRLLPLVVVALVLAAAPAGAQVVGISPWFASGNLIAIGARNGEVLLMNSGGGVASAGNALTGRPLGEWLAGLSALNNNTNTIMLLGVTNTGAVVRGDDAGHWGTSRNIFTDTGRPPSEVIAMQAGTHTIAILAANGDVFELQEWPGFDLTPTVYRGNMGNIPTASLPVTWGRVKAERR